MRVFLDVGGHVGETLAVAVQPRWEFDRIWSFEPTSVCVPFLERYAGDRVEIVRAGWWSADCEMDLHDPGSIGASVLADRATSGTTERCRFLDAAAWMERNIDAKDEVWLKLNVEAGEIEILRHLLDTGEIHKVNHLVVHFDVRKHGLGALAEPVREQLGAAGVPFVEAGDVMFGRTHEAQTACWLDWTMRTGLGSSARFATRRAVHRARRRVFRLRKRLRR